MKYIFIHIPKTAGTSFRSELIKNIKSNYHGYADLEGLVNNNHYLHEIKSPFNNPSIFEQYETFSSHMAYGLHAHLNSPYTYLTVLRNPVDRIISHYRFDMQRIMIPTTMTVLEWLNDGRIGHTNILTNVMSGYQHYDTSVDYYVKRKLAIENLKKESTIFGFSEKYNEFLGIVRNNLGWNVNNQKLNKTIVPNTVDEEVKNILRELCSNDIDFYVEALNIYNEKYKKILV